MRSLVIFVGAFLCGALLYTLLWRTPAESVAAVIPDDLDSQPVLLQGLGDHHFEITATHPEAQRWFDQGLVLTYGFNHDAAARSFLKATEFDPDCAMCWWGAALVLGPHVNAGMDPSAHAPAWERLRRALDAAPRASEREQAYITALAQRYTADPPPDRRPLDEAYALAMRELIARYPGDLDARTLFAEALMNLHPWDFYSRDGSARPWTPEIVAVLERVLLDDSEHPGANHYYIHAIEASATPERGLEAARRLDRLVPAAGHLLHMPAHIYMRTGRYREASEASLRGIQADRDYLALCRPGSGIYPQGYVPHNFHFLYASSLMEGNSARALEAASEIAKRMDLDQSRQPGYAALQHYWVSPYLARLRFGRWNEVLAEPPPPADLVYPTAIWRYARGLAQVRQNRPDGPDAAEAERIELARALADPALADASMWGLNRLVDILTVAERTLAGEIAAARGDYAFAVDTLKEAVESEAHLNYDEPPAWYFPVRHALGAVLLQAGRAAEAEQVYLADLTRNRENGWALFGLTQALRAQGRVDEADKAEARFKAAWAHADVTLTASRF